MDKTQVVKNWIHKYDVVRLTGSKTKAFGLGWKLITDYQYFLETGCCPETKKEYYDYSQFIHEFADSFAPSDDELYQWIVKHGYTILHDQPKAQRLEGEIPNNQCPLCNLRLGPEKVARKEDGTVRLSPAGNAWCQPCANKVDQKFWSTA